MNILETSQNEHTACKAQLEESKANASQLEGEKTELGAAVEAGKAQLEESKANASQLGLALLQVQQVRLAPLDLFAHLLACRSLLFFACSSRSVFFHSFALSSLVVLVLCFSLDDLALCLLFARCSHLFWCVIVFHVLCNPVRSRPPPSLFADPHSSLTFSLTS